VHLQPAQGALSKQRLEFGLNFINADPQHTGTAKQETTDGPSSYPEKLAIWTTTPGIDQSEALRASGAKGYVLLKQ